LRFDPVLREERWTTIMDLAKVADHRRLTQISGRLDEAVTNVAENTALASSAKLEVEEQRELSRTLRGELDRRLTTPAAGGGESTTVTGAKVEQLPTTDAGEVAAAETVSPGALGSGVVASPAPTVPLRHEQMELPVEAAPTITEGLV
jgi:hypothetical protein